MELGFATALTRCGSWMFRRCITSSICLMRKSSRLASLSAGAAPSHVDPPAWSNAATLRPAWSTKRQSTARQWIQEMKPRVGQTAGRPTNGQMTDRRDAYPTRSLCGRGGCSRHRHSNLPRGVAAARRGDEDDGRGHFVDRGEPPPEGNQTFDCRFHARGVGQFGEQAFVERRPGFAGRTAFTRMPCETRSTAHSRVSAFMAPFDAA